jgi:hypothetical protein
VLNAPQNLLGGQCITSPAGQYMLYMGTDGNFFIYDIAHSTGTWGPGTQGHPGAYASMQTDGQTRISRVPAPVLPALAFSVRFTCVASATT